jgi:hypothetical protein
LSLELFSIQEAISRHTRGLYNKTFFTFLIAPVW